MGNETVGYLHCCLKRKIFEHAYERKGCCGGGGGLEYEGWRGKNLDNGFCYLH